MPLQLSQPGPGSRISNLLAMSFRQTLPLLTQKSKSKSSKQWISRQSRDPYVKKRLSGPASYRSRSSFKLLEINDQMAGFLDQRDVRVVVDLGAAPGGWTQVVAEKFGWLAGRNEADELQDLDASPVTSLSRARGTIVAVDLLPFEPIPGVHVVRGDFLLDSTTEQIRRLLASKHNNNADDAKADVILSDMAVNVSGNTVRDTESSLEICEAVFEFARLNLRSAREIGRRKGGVLLYVSLVLPSSFFGG